MPAPTAAPPSTFAVCLNNAEYPASLEIRKLYPVLDDAEAEAEGLIRIIDESGGDYLYPASMFEKLTLPDGVLRALTMAS